MNFSGWMGNFRLNWIKMFLLLLPLLRLTQFGSLFLLFFIQFFIAIPLFLLCAAAALVVVVFAVCATMLWLTWLLRWISIKMSVKCHVFLFSSHFFMPALPLRAWRFFYAKYNNCTWIMISHWKKSEWHFINF